jgi:hypothetical protein
LRVARLLQSTAAMLKVTTLLTAGLLATSLSACDPDTPAAGDAGHDGAVAADAPAAPDAAVPDAGGGTSFTVDGITTGDAVPATGQIAVVWSVFTGSNDHAYFFGHGTQTDGTFHLPLLAAPPAEALNNGTGVGLVLLFRADAVLPPDGVYEGDAPAGLLGAAVRHAVIYRAASANAQTLPWSTAFPTGYSCGSCVDVPNGFDTYAPIACDQVDVKAPTDLSTLDGCNFF